MNWEYFLKKLLPSSQIFLYDERRKDWGLSVFFVRPFSLKEASYGSMLGRVLETTSKRYPSLLEMVRRQDELYGSYIFSNIESFADRLVISFHLRSLRDKYVPEAIFEETLSFFEDILFQPHVDGEAFAVDAFKVERERLIDAMDSFREDPMNLAYSGALRGCLKGELGSLPMENREILDMMTPELLYAYYQMLLDEGTRHLVVKGAFPELTEGVFKPIPTFLPVLESGKMHVEEGPFSQSVMVQMYTTDCPFNSSEALAMYLFTAIWGGVPFSLLFENLRERMGLCYNIGAHYSRSLSLVSVSAAFNKEDYNKLEESIACSLRALKKEGISEESFRGIKEQLRSSMIHRSEGIGSDINGTFYRALSGEKSSLRERLQRLENITLEEVLRAGQSLTLHSSFTILGIAK